jgi:hypothetical protein
MMSRRNWTLQNPLRQTRITVSTHAAVAGRKAGIQGRDMATLGLADEINATGEPSQDC